MRCCADSFLIQVAARLCSRRPSVGAECGRLLGSCAPPAACLSRTCYRNLNLIPPLILQILRTLTPLLLRSSAPPSSLLISVLGPVLPHSAARFLPSELEPLVSRSRPAGQLPPLFTPAFSAQLYVYPPLPWLRLRLCALLRLYATPPLQPLPQPQPLVAAATVLEAVPLHARPPAVCVLPRCLCG